MTDMPPTQSDVDDAFAELLADVRQETHGAEMPGHKADAWNAPCSPPREPEHDEPIPLIGVAAVEPIYPYIADPPDWTRCPACGLEGFDVVGVQVIFGHAGINTDGDPQWDGGTKMFWDTSTTIAYQCASCLADMPKAYEDVLAAALGKPDRDRWNGSF